MAADVEVDADVAENVDAEIIVAAASLVAAHAAGFS